jgi:hypothetical protein
MEKWSFTIHHQILCYPATEAFNSHRGTQLLLDGLNGLYWKPSILYTDLYSNIVQTVHSSSSPTCRVSERPDTSGPFFLRGESGGTYTAIHRLLTCDLMSVQAEEGIC